MRREEESAGRYVGRNCAASAYISSVVRLNAAMPRRTKPVRTAISKMIQSVAHTCAGTLGYMMPHCVASESLALRKYLSSAMSPGLFVSNAIEPSGEEVLTDNV